MDIFTWLALGSYGLAFLITAAFACAYLARSTFMPYHEVAAGRAWTEVDPGMQLLLLALIKVVGAASLALAVGGYFQLYMLFSGQWTYLLLIGFQIYCLITIAPPVMIATVVRRKTTARPPIFSGCVALILTLAGFTFALLSGRYV